MGGGSWNGKNFGGMHTGADKKQNGGPYHNNGYVHEPNVSHLDFAVGEKVIYTGSEKYKHKSRVPNGSKGIVMKKDNLSNKRQKTSRSILKVDFGQYGINYIRKGLLQFPSDYSECLEEQLDKMNHNEGIQDYRNEMKKITQEKLQPSKYKKIIENRLKNKEFREWRQEFLDKKKLELEGNAHKIKLSDEYKGKRTRHNKLKVELEEITSLYEGSGDKAYVEVSKDCLSKNPQATKDEIQKMFNVKKNKDTRIIGMLKNSMRDIENYFDKSSKEYKELTECIHGGSRQYVREVSCKEDYNNYLHHHYEQRNIPKEDMVDYKYKSLEENEEESEEVKEVVKNYVEPKNINLLLWGLYPKDVSY